MQGLPLFLRWMICGAVFCTVLFLQSWAPVNAQGGQQEYDWDSWDVIPGQIIIQYQPERSNRIQSQTATAEIPGLSLTPIEAPVKETVQQASGPAVEFISILPDTFIGEFDPSERDRILQALSADPDVVYFEPARARVIDTMWGTSTPNDPDLGTLWGMQRIGAPAAWAQQPAQRAAVRAAVMEERYDDTHPDLAAQNSPVQNNSQGVSQHATHVAGIIAATGNNNRDVVGVANVELVSLSWPTSNITFAQQVTWAVNNQIRVINMSFKYCGDDGIDNGDDCGKCLYPAPSTTDQNAINNAVGNIVFVAAAANDSCNQDSNNRDPLPAGYDNVTAVSALDLSDNLATFSNHGAYVDLTAPGVNIASTVPPSNVGNMNGTSQAAPHVAGSAAAVLAVDQTFDVRSINRLLALSAEDIGTAGRDDDFGAGVVRVDRAVAAIADVYAEGPTCGTGTLFDPYCTLGTAIANVPTNGTLGLVGGRSFGPITIEEPVTIVSVGGTATIGQ